MGNVCCGSKDEATKPSVLQPEEATQTSSSDVDHAGTTIGGSKDPHAPSHQHQSNKAVETPEQMQVVKREQARLEWIVQATGRRMVAIRSARSTQGYYVDQGFAAALYQHLEQTTAFSEQSELYPAIPTLIDESKSVYEKLTAPQWDSIAVGTDDNGVAGCGGKNPHEYLDHVSETFLERSIPKNLFTECEPIVENLL